MKKGILFAILIVLLVISDYLLFGRFEYVFPFFVFPYAIILLIYVIKALKSHELTLPMFCLYSFIIIPVFAGFVMAVAWMIKINFFGELFGGYLIDFGSTVR